MGGNMFSVSPLQGCCIGFGVWLPTVGSGIVGVLSCQSASNTLWGFLLDHAQVLYVSNESSVVSDIFPGLLLNGRFMCFNLFDAGTWQKPSIVLHLDYLAGLKGVII